MRVASAATRVNGPMRPRYINAHRVSWEGVLNDAVIPVDNPVVANAEMTSKLIWSTLNLSLIHI